VNPETTLLVTGANGWIGQAVMQQAQSRGLRVRGAVRENHSRADNSNWRQVGEIDGMTPWGDALANVEAVVHCAARVHVMKDQSDNPLREFRRTNVEGTLNLAKQAAQAGVRRLIYLSSVKVNGEFTSPGQRFRASDVPAPKDAYGISKWEAEIGLRKIASETGLNVVIIRPPLVYGPGVKANFASMVRWVRRGLPLPLGAIHNQRSLVGLDNLTDLILLCTTHSLAENLTFMASDAQDVSTTELLRKIGDAVGCPARLIAMPQKWIELCAAAIGRKDLSQRLCGSLQVDISETQRILGWIPPISLAQGLQSLANVDG
jgi:UDP-glucose 4-epimerase